MDRNSQVTKKSNFTILGKKEWFNRLFGKKLALCEKHTKSISKFAFAFVETEFKGTRMAAMGHFSIFYKVTDTRIIVTAFWDNRQDPKGLLRIIKSN